MLEGESPAPIVLTHNVWAVDWRVVITLLGWIMLSAGTARISLPDLIQKIGETMLRHWGLIMVPACS